MAKLMENNILSNPIVIGLMIGAPSFALGYLGYRRSQKTDNAAKETGALGQIIEGLNKLIDNLQDDNVVLRHQIKSLQIRLETVTSDRDKLKRKVMYLEKKYG